MDSMHRARGAIRLARVGSISMKKFRWTDWLAAVAIVMALGAFAGAEASQDAGVSAEAR
ncbi:MAG: hypothetical protein RJA44_519 [Pseudomonadota bacterium]